MRIIKRQMLALYTPLKLCRSVDFLIFCLCIAEPVAFPNIQSAQMSVEQRAFRRCHQVFHDGVDPSSLVPVLYSKSLLTPEERERAIHSTATDRERIQAILTALERRISIEPSPFHVMLAALMSEPALDAVGCKIEGELNIYCQWIAVMVLLILNCSDI